MSSVSKEYIEGYLQDGKEKSLRVEVYYSLGGMNYFSGRVEKRGYYLSVTPVEHARGFESMMAFSGTKQLILEVARKSAKAEKEALALAEQAKEALIDYVVKDNHLTRINDPAETPSVKN